MGILGTVSELPDERGLAAPGFSNNEDHPSLTIQRTIQESIQLPQLTISGHENRPLNFNPFFFGKEERRSGSETRSASGGGHRRFHRSIPDLLIQPGALFPRFDPQFFLQQTTAALVLGQGGTPLATKGQQAHQLPVGFLMPGLQLHQTPGIGTGLFILPASLVISRHLMKRGQSLTLESLPRERAPVLKGSTVLYIETLQEAPSI
jgi:hypothetical protein